MGRLTGNAAAPEVVAGRYTIERELGRGGSAVVYLARDGAQGGLIVHALYGDLRFWPFSPIAA